MHFRFNFDACPMHSPSGFVHLTHQNLSARALFCLNSLAKVNTQLLIYNWIRSLVLHTFIISINFIQLQEWMWHNSASYNMWPNMSKWGWCRTLTKLRFCYWIKQGSFWHKDCSYIIFHSRDMIKLWLLYWVTGNSSSKILALQSFILSTCQWYQNKKYKK